MADGAKSLGKQITSTFKDIGQDLTVNLVSDLFNPPTQKSTTQAQPTALNAQITQAQKNAQIAQILRRIQAMKQRQQQATNLAKQKENQRLQKLQQEEQQKKQAQQCEKEGKNKPKDLFANWGNILARRGKGEQRGNKMYG